jgi:hypothetical protein
MVDKRPTPRTASRLAFVARAVLPPRSERGGGPLFSVEQAF